MNNLSEMNVFSAAIKAGFNVKTANDIKFQISNEIELYIVNGEDLSEFKIKTQRIGDSIMTSARVSGLCSVEHNYTPQFSMSTHDVDYRSTSGISAEDFEITLGEIDYANRMTMAILKKFISMKKELIAASNEKALEVKNNQAIIAKRNEQKRLKRIADYDLTLDKFGQEKAATVIKEMEEETFKKEEGVFRIFTFVTRSGHLDRRKISTKWEKQRLSWYSAKGSLLMNEEVLAMLSKARIEKN